GLTSNNSDTNVAIIENGTKVVVYTGLDSSNTANYVLSATINIDGTYSITQHQAIEQVTGVGDINELIIGVDVTDTDGDTVPNAANINITIADGALATATDSNVTFTETQGV
ncbi:hypothetical protein, partial [Vibrio sp. F74]|uniref:hypothetical protein n=1 Tax=Vibrio sp. F74 TaxID=700020 RepID=UPI0035F54C26